MGGDPPRRGMIDEPTDRAPLRARLAAAREAGFLGPGSVDAHIDHALAFAGNLSEPGFALDLGSGAGVPGLALASLIWPTTRWILLDSGQRRCAFLEDAVHHLALGNRVEVVRARAEEAGRNSALRGTCDLVTARSFGPPAVTAECGAPFLTVGGHLVVSDPPGGAPERWSLDGVGQLGLEPLVERSIPSGFAMAMFAATSPCPDRYPRRVGIPAKRPLF